MCHAATGDDHFDGAAVAVDGDQIGAQAGGQNAPIHQPQHLRRTFGHQPPCGSERQDALIDQRPDRQRQSGDVVIRYQRITQPVADQFHCGNVASL
jgi:hypothetical protein